jgi:hypothetical protein
MRSDSRVDHAQKEKRKPAVTRPGGVGRRAPNCRSPPLEAYDRSDSVAMPLAGSGVSQSWVAQTSHCRVLSDGLGATFDRLHEDGQRENTALHPNNLASGSVGRIGRVNWRCRCVRRGSPDPAETPDRRSPFLLPGLTQETIGLQNQPATTRGPSVGTMGWSGDQSTTRIGIETKRKTSQEETCGRAFRRGRETRAEQSAKTMPKSPAPTQPSQTSHCRDLSDGLGATYDRLHRGAKFARRKQRLVRRKL